MRIRRLLAMATKETRQIWRDPRSLLIALLMPFMQMALLGYGVNLDIKHVPICVFDREGSQQSQALMKAFQASLDRKSTRLNSSHRSVSRMPSSA